MLERGKTIVLHLRHAIWCNLLTQAAKQRCEIFEFESIAVNLSFYALIWKLSRQSSERTLGISYNVTNMEWSQKTWPPQSCISKCRFPRSRPSSSIPFYPVESAALSFQHANPMEILRVKRNCGLWVVHEGSGGATVTGLKHRIVYSVLTSAIAPSRLKRTQFLYSLRRKKTSSL